MTWNRPTKQTLVVLAVPLLLFSLGYIGWSWNSRRRDVTWSPSTLRGDDNARWPPWTLLPYTFGYAMLLQTLEGYRQAGWRDIVIVDNR
jgi:hypothetical protein